jgi:curved DNA-binding protein CbpA
MPVKNRRNYYRILQVQPDAPAQVIRASYRVMMRELGEHPDMGGSNDRAALLNEAYAVLGNPQRRAAYDRALFNQYTKQLVPREASPKTPVVTVFCPNCKTPLTRQPSTRLACPSCRTRLEPATKARIARDYRRSVLRVRSEQRMLYRSEGDREYREAKMTDISPRGMRLRCGEELACHSVLKISAPKFEALAVVTNVHRTGTAGRPVYDVGLAFVTVDFEDSRGSFLSTSA